MKYMYIYKILLILLNIKCEYKINCKCSQQYYNKDIATMVGNGVTEHMVADIKKKQCYNLILEIQT